MQAMIQGRNVIMVFLDSKGKQSRTADAGRMRRWLEALKPAGIPATAAAGVPVTVSATAPAAVSGAAPAPIVQ
jgi:D-alanyl-D-alanine endopeptidase (penicillin-binding protein 7)